jgi:hypothetical protein
VVRKPKPNSANGTHNSSTFQTGTRSKTTSTRTMPRLSAIWKTRSKTRIEASRNSGKFSGWSRPSMSWPMVMTVRLMMV